MPFEVPRLCAVWHMLHLECPGCGLTRSLCALLQGDLRASIDFHPLGVVVVVASGVVVLLAFRVGATARQICVTAAGMGTIVQWIVKLMVS